MAHSADSDPAALLAAAAAHYAAGRLDDAAVGVARAEALAPASPEVWHLKGVVALAGGQPEAGVAALAHAIRLAPDRVEPRLAAASALGALGRAAEAVAHLRHAQQAAPTRTDIDALLAPLLWQLDQREAAIDAYTRVWARAPDDAATLSRLVLAMGRAGRLFEALVGCLHLAMLLPGDAVTACNLAMLLGRLGAGAASRAWFGRALALDPDEPAARAALATPAPPDDIVPADPVLALCHALARAPDAAAPHAALARALLAQGHRDAAIALLRRAVALDAAQPDALAELAHLLAARGDSADAEAVLRAALRLRPDDAALHAALGDLLKRTWRAEEAVPCYRRALELRPELPEVMANLADALMAAGASEEAAALCRRALALRPDLVEAQAWLGYAMALLQRPAAALDALRPAIAARPEESDWHIAAAGALLAQGDLAAGWAEYAWRWRFQAPMSHRAPADPFARPDPAGWSGRTVLLYAEQGHGDTLQFLRYARLAAARGARVLLEVQPALKSLAAGIPGLAGVFAIGEPLPPFDIAVPLLHLPWAFGTTLETIPATVPYLRADLARAAAWRRRMMGLPGVKVGLVWAGDPRPHLPGAHQLDRRRSASLAAFAPLARVPGVVLVSLQKGAPAAQAATPPPGMVLHDWTDELADFADSAALMTALDLVVTVDTAAVHLAGALGRPVWLLNRYDSCWRWLIGRDDSPWYPTLRQFRQARPGDWAGVVARVAEALRDRAA